MLAQTVMTAHLSASLLCADLLWLQREIDALEEAGIDSLHLDVMDGHFVPNLAFGTDAISAVRRATTLPVHVHLMVERPGEYVAAAAEAGVDVCIFHIETEPYPLRLADRIRTLGMAPGVAVNPVSPVAVLGECSADYVLLMSAEPGFAGQGWVTRSLDHVREARAMVRDGVVIGLDGSVTAERATAAAAAGASLFVCGTSSLFRGARSGYASAVQDFRATLAASAGP